MPNEVTVSFLISGTDFEPERVTSALSLEPSATWISGDQIPGTKRKWEFCGWCLESPAKEDSEDVDAQMRALIAILSPRAAAIRGLPFETEVEFSCVVYAYEYVPALNFQCDLMREVVGLGASIDIDLYCMMED